MSFDSPLAIDECKISVSVVWNISNLELYVTQGREDFSPVVQEMIKDTLKNALADNVDRESLRSYVWSTMREKAGPLEELGVNYLRSFPRSENCDLE